MTPVAYILHFTLPFLSSKKFRLPKLGHGARVLLTDVAAHENSCSPHRTIFENSIVAQVTECSEDVTRRERPPYVYQFPGELERMHIFSFPNTSQIQSTKERAIAQRSITVMQWQGEADFF